MAQGLAEKYDGRVVSFATKLKELALDLGWDGNKDDRGRRFLQELGQTLRRYDPGYWIKAARFDPVIDDGAIFVDDLRFPNECNYLKRNGFHIVYLEPKGFSMDEAWRADPSETSLGPEDAHTILASHKGSPGVLVASAVALVQRLTTPVEW